MSELFRLSFRPELEQELAAADRAMRDRILKAIELRLTVKPLSYGKPLGGRFAGYRRIRVGDYRVAYQVRGRSVIVWMARPRKTMYQDLARRALRAGG